jgi:hypothetical protein
MDAVPKMAQTRFIAAAIAGHCAIAAWLPAQVVKPQTVSDYECYVQSAESRMAGRKTFLAADASPSQIQDLVRGAKIVTVPGSGSNPHKISGGMVYDWIGTVFIPGATVEQTVHMLQDYDHRAEYFHEVLASSKLMCRTGEDRFGFTMRLKEPAVLDVESDVTWERVDAGHWRCRSYSSKVQEIGKQHGYLLRLNSYWRFAGTEKGVFVEGETVTLSGEFGSLMRTLGSLAGINPEKSLKKSLESIRETLGARKEFPSPATGRPECEPPVKAPACTLQSTR